MSAPVTERSVDPRYARSRAALLAAIGDLLTERDLRDIAVTDVVARAQVSRPTFYQHFADLADLAHAAALARLESVFDEVDEAACTEPPAREALLALLTRLDTHRNFYRHALAAAGTQQLFDAIVGVVRTRILAKSPLSPVDPDVATVMSGGLTWLISRWLDQPAEDADSAERLADRVAGVLGLLTG